MPLEIVTIPLGPMENNTYLVGETESGAAVVIDPSFGSGQVLEEAARRSWTLTAVWLTHAHFDHIAGVKELVENSSPPLPVGLHPEDLPLWRADGGASNFGISLDPGPEPSLRFTHGMQLWLGNHVIEVRHAPGHTAGHVIFYAASAAAALCGDVIFYRGIGRTDLPGGSHERLLRSIREQVFRLPPETRLLSGHGPETTVADEQAENPFL